MKALNFKKSIIKLEHQIREKKSARRRVRSKRAEQQNQELPRVTKTPKMFGYSERMI